MQGNAGSPTATRTFFKSTWSCVRASVTFVVARGGAPERLLYLLATAIVLAVFIAFIAFVS
jgi:hypothetical protein